jgi:DeoR family transcriptional regulator, suf operon transcriptional repressor
MYKNSDARDRVLHRVRVRGSATVDELACDLGVVPVTMRTHLAALEAQGLLQSTDERGHVGRPRRRYRLTDKANAALPHGYAGLTADLLDALQSLAGKRGVDQLWDVAAARHAARHSASVAGATLADRVAAVARVLQDESGLADWRQDGDRFVMRDLHCPYAALASERSEVCRYHVQVLTRLLGEPVMLEQSIASGQSHCDFVVSSRPVQRPSAVRTMSDGRPRPEPIKNAE